MDPRTELVNAILELADARVRHEQADPGPQAGVLAARVVRQRRRIRLLATMIGVVSALAGPATAGDDSAIDLSPIAECGHESP